MTGLVPREVVLNHRGGRLKLLCPRVAAVQFAMPTATEQFDTVSSFPGIGRLSADGKGCQWLPTDCSIL
jgi:hypothetical protein